MKYFFKKIKDFNLDYFANFNQNLNEERGDSHFAMIMHVSFFLGINVLSLILFLLFICSLFISFTISPSRLLFLIPSILIFLLSLYWFYFRLNYDDKQLLLNRKSQYVRKHFIIYEIITTIIFILATILGSTYNSNIL